MEGALTICECPLIRLPEWACTLAPGAASCWFLDILRSRCFQLRSPVSVYGPPAPLEVFWLFLWKESGRVR